MKRIALIVTGTALLVASCGIASAASKTEATMPNHVIVPYPAELETKALVLAPNTAYQLLNPVSPEQQVAKAERRRAAPVHGVAGAAGREGRARRAAPVHGVAGAAGRKGRARRAAPEARDEADLSGDRFTTDRLRHGGLLRHRLQPVLRRRAAQPVAAEQPARAVGQLGRK